MYVQRCFSRIVLILFSLVIMSNSPAIAATSPNIVFILVDDVRWDMMSTLNPIIQTPAISALAKEGVHFTNAYVTTPICAASRASIFTGVWESTHRCNFPGLKVDNAVVSTAYPKMLKDNGYITGHIGKYGVMIQDDAYRSSLFTVYDDGGCTHNTTKGEPQMVKNYLGRTNVSRTDIETEKAIDFINQNAEKPFCLQVSYHGAHAQDDLPAQYPSPSLYDSLYLNELIPPARLSDDATFKALPKFLQTSRAHKHYLRRFETPAHYQTMVKAYYRMITHIDASIAEIRKTLSALKIADNTVIMYMSDNGYLLGEWQMGDKYYGWEESLRVPLIIYDPRSTAQHGLINTNIALNVDITPTILNLAGVPIPSVYQGTSLVPLINGQAVPEWRNEFYFEQHFDADVHAMYGVRTPQWKYVDFYTSNAYEQLYDLSNDPGEERNVAADPKSGAALAEMRKKAADYITRYTQSVKK